ncbi:MAG: DNA-directed RNA polymerase subunit omega [Clostridia bacterium]|nr:DNA-directed RNA polymerase subunit omega [Clostridia bacterium]
MLYPAVAELEKVAKSRYALVITIAKRARQISENAEACGTELAEKPVKLAIMDIYNGKVALKNQELSAEE